MSRFGEWGRTKAFGAVMKMLSLSWRIREEVPADCRAIFEGDEIAVIAFWHHSMLPVWFRFRRLNAAALISQSRDGEVLADYLSRSLGYERIVRGSSTKGGGEALREIVDELRTRSCLITPDGPRGPAQIAKPGTLVASARSGRPILLVGWTSRNPITLNSWDRMRIPRPFAAINFRCLRIEPPPLDDSGRVSDRAIQHVQEALDRLDRGKP